MVQLGRIQMDRGVLVVRPVLRRAGYLLLIGTQAGRCFGFAINTTPPNEGKVNAIVGVLGDIRSDGGSKGPNVSPA